MALPFSFYKTLELASIALFYKDANGKYLAINPVGASVLNCKIEEVIGKTDAAFFQGLTPRIMGRRDAEVRTRNEPFAHQWKASTSTGIKTFHAIKARSNLGSGDGLLGLSLVNHESNPDLIYLMTELMRTKRKDLEKYVFSAAVYGGLKTFGHEYRSSILAPTTITPKSSD